MAGYRPKSLNELNEMYDKTITAEKAILKATKALEAETQKPAEKPEKPAESHEVQPSPAVTSLSDEVDSLINSFAVQNEKEAASVKIPTPEKITFEKETKPKAEPTAEPKTPDVPSEIQPEKEAEKTLAPTKTKVIYNLSTPEETQEKAFARSDERSELLEEYKRIMADDDDDVSPAREPFGKKKKKRKKGIFFHSSSKSIKEDESPDFELPETEDEPEEQPFEVPVVSFVPDITLPQDILPSDEATSEENASSFFSYEESDSSENEEPQEFLNKDEDTPGVDSDSEPRQSAFEYELSDDDKSDVVVPEELQNRTYDEYINESPDDIYSFDRTKENTLPAYAKDEYQPSEDEEAFEEDDSYETPGFAKERKGKRIFVSISRVCLSIMLAFLLLSSAFAISVNYLFHTDTGILFGDDRYVFTADRDYINAGIVKDDLVITEKRYADTGESFAYINYTEQCFMFGKMSGSIINDEGDVLFIAENNSERVLVLRDDTKGVVLNVYPSLGKLFRLCSENFIAVVSVLLITSLVIILLLALVLKDKEKSQQRMIKRMVKKGIIADEETAEELVYEDDSSTEDEDLFSTIE